MVTCVPYEFVGSLRSRICADINTYGLTFVQHIIVGTQTLSISKTFGNDTPGAAFGGALQARRYFSNVLNTYPFRQHK